MQPFSETFRPCPDLPEWLIQKWQEHVDLLAGLLHLPAVVLLKANPEMVDVLASSQAAPAAYRPGAAQPSRGLYCQALLETGQILRIDDAAADLGWAASRDLHLGLRAFLGLPIEFPARQAYGALCAFDSQARPFSALEEQLLRHYKDAIELDLALLQAFDCQSAKQAQTVLAHARRARCLAATSAIAADSRDSFEEALASIVHLIRAAWQNPDALGVKITCADRLVSSPGCAGAPAHSVEIAADAAPAGQIELYLKQDLPAEQREAILPEDQNLLAAIARQVGSLLERQRAAEALRQHAAEMEAIFRAQNDIVLVYDPNMTVRRANTAFQSVYGFDPTSRNLSEIIQRVNCRTLDNQPLDWSRLPTPRSLSGEKGATALFKVTRADGSEGVVETSSSPMRVGGAIAGSVTVWHDISDRIKFEEALREGEERYRRIVETALEGIWIIDEDSRTSFVNQRMAEMLGYSVDDMTGATLFDFMDEEGQRAAAAQVERRRQGVAEQHDFKFRRKDGSDLWALVETNPIFDRDGRYLGALGMVTDITKRKQIENQLQQSQARLQEAQRIAGLGSWEWDARAQRVIWSKEMYNLALLDESQPPPPHTEHARLYTPESMRRLAEAAGRAIETGQPYELDVEMIRADGTRKWLSARGEPLYDERGLFAGLHGTVLDISARKRIEQEAQTFHHKVLEEKNHLDAVLDVLPVGVAILDAQGGIMLANLEYEQIWGTERPEVRLIADYEPYRAWWAGSGRRVAPEEWASALALSTGQKVTGQLLEIERFDGAHLFVLNSGVPIHDETGQIVGAAVAIMDVTDLKHAQADLAQAKDSLDAANRELQLALEREKLLARTDSLTAIHNRRFFFEIAEHEFAEARRYHLPLSVILFDIDHFKHFNDRYGHQAGDEILKQLTRLAGAQLRESDTLARYGGEEFVILLPNTAAPEAGHVAERIRESVAAYQMEVDGQTVSITVSLGIAECPCGGGPMNLEGLIFNADQALYSAKNAGRNRTVVYSNSDGFEHIE